MDKPIKKYKCPLCGAEFTEEEAKKSCNRVCFRSCSSCPLLSCPNCGYKIPEESKILKWITNMFEKENR